MNQKLINAIARNLTPDLLKDDWKELNRSNRMAGHCYVASEAYYHLSGEEVTPCCVEVRFYYKKYKVWGPVNHWYLKNKKTGEIIDITASQFPASPAYDHGRGSGFLTRKPSLRAQTLIARVRKDESWKTN